jgi:hypothetical protein
MPILISSLKELGIISRYNESNESSYGSFTLTKLFLIFILVEIWTEVWREKQRVSFVRYQ